MADPLSITAGVIGVITAAAQISSLLIKFTRSVKEAPQQARVIITEVSDTSGILSHLQSFLLGNEFLDRSRTSLLKVDQVVTIVSGCVLTFSELEKLLDEMKAENMAVLDCMKWARKESAIMDLIQRLQNHKASLSLMLNILNGNTIVEAKDSVDRLYALVENYYQNMSSRVQALELRELQRTNGDTSTLRDGDGASIITTVGYVSKREDSIAVADGEVHFNSTQDLQNSEIYSVTGASPTAVAFDFTEDLQRSWVYRRNGAFRGSIFSFSTTDAHSTSWSCLSGISMAEVSNISVMNLAITADEVYNPQRSSQTWSSDNVLPDLVPLPSIATMPYQELAGEDDVAYPCKGCGEILEEGKAMQLGVDRNNRWHLDCYRCNTCATILNEDANVLLLSDGGLICKNCTYDCSICGNKIEDLAILTGDKAFCSTCFKCRNCKTQIEDLKYARTSQGIFCMRCHESLMARRRSKRKELERRRQILRPHAPNNDPPPLPSLPQPQSLDLMNSSNDSMWPLRGMNAPTQRSNLSLPVSQLGFVSEDDDRNVFGFF